MAQSPTMAHLAELPQLAESSRNMPRPELQNMHSRPRISPEAWSWSNIWVPNYPIVIVLPKDKDGMA
jgi:hypothetical protein